MSEQRNFGLDLLRVLACLLVIMAHSGECFYIGKFYAGGFDAIDWTLWRSDAAQVAVIGTICRTSVPLFVMISGFFLLPVRQGQTTLQFYRKRFTRILFPLLFWILFYAFYQPFEAAGWSFTAYSLATVWSNLWHSFVSFPPVYGHLWYVYMLIGLYLFIPVISPWVERASRTDMRVFLGIWTLSLMVPYLQLVQPEVLGVSYWNPNGSLYYFTGFIGYLVLGAYARKYMMEESANRQRIIALLLIAAGMAWSMGDMLHRISMAEAYCTADNYATGFFPWLEFCWNFSTLPVAMMTAGVFLLFFRMQSTAGKYNVCHWLVGDISRLSYGMYLMHIIFVAIYFPLFDLLSIPTACKIPLIALSTYITSYLLTKLLSCLPKSKYVIG